VQIVVDTVQKRCDNGASKRSKQMTNLPKLSNRAQKALDVLADGGRFVYRLERNSFTGREQFRHRLQAAGGFNVSGVGLSAFYELEKAGFLTLAGGGTSVSTYYKLSVAA
jgi:hypothetical protein